MTALNKQALREAAVRAGGGKWIYIRTLSLSSAYITEDTGETVINCTAGDVPAKYAGFLELANPATVLALLDELDELDAANELVELQRFKLERQAEDLHQAKSLEGIHREKRLEVEREFRDYKDRAESNQMRLAKEVCRLEDELQAAGIGVKGE